MLLTIDRRVLYMSLIILLLLVIGAKTGATETKRDSDLRSRIDARRKQRNDERHGKSVPSAVPQQINNNSPFAQAAQQTARRYPSLDHAIKRLS